MLYISLGFFGIAALFGLYLLSYILTNKNTPKGVALTHGFFAVLGVVVLILYCLFYSPSPLASLVLFIFAALGGLMLFYRDITAKPIPKWLALGHGLTAVIGVCLLVLFMVNSL